MTDVIVLGLDGATWDLLDPLIEEGRLPNIERLVERGYDGVLESTYPPITAPAWLSMATGQNPGKTGVFYFLNRDDPDSFDFEPMGVDDFRGRSFWDVLAPTDTSVGVFNFPMLYPPYEPGDGFMVAGFGAPEDETITAPASLQDELDDVTGGYEVKVPYADPKYNDRPGALETDLHRVLEKREAAIEHLLTEHRPDVFFGVLSVTDWAQHYFWRHHDADHVLHEPGNEEVLADLFARVDETVGAVAEFADAEDATLLLVSDHGFGPVNGTLYSNEWLERAGLRVPSGGLLSEIRSRYFPYVRRTLEPVVSLVPLLNDLATDVGRSVRASPLDNVDRERSVAFASKQGFTTGLVYLLSDDPEDRERVVEELRELCRARDLELDVHAPDDLYHGPNVDLAPDVLFDVEGLEYAVDPRYSTDDDVVVERPPSAARSGGHRREGIYVAAGPHVVPDEGPRRPLLDVAPTLLALSGNEIPEGMDGEAMTAAFEHLEAPERAPLSELVGRSVDGERQDADDVRDRLEDLGYL